MKGDIEKKKLEAIEARKVEEVLLSKQDCVTCILDVETEIMLLKFCRNHLRNKKHLFHKSRQPEKKLLSSNQQ